MSWIIKKYKFVQNYFIGFFVIATIFAFSAYFFQDAFAEQAAFNKVVVKENPGSFPIKYYAIFALFFLFMSAIAVMYFILGKKLDITFMSDGIKRLSETEQVERLVDSFYSMAKTIEDRDKNLKADKNRAENANKAKSDFLLNISHELRTPMHAILNFAEMGKEKTNSNRDEKISLCFSRIEESGQRLLELINRILDLTRLESGEVRFDFSKSDIYKCAQDSLNSLQSLIDIKKINIKIDKKTENTEIFFDYPHIVQVFVNLISNAIKFTPEKGDINIVIEENKIALQGDKKEDSICVSVINEGDVIPDKDLEIIFNKFIQSSHTDNSTGGSGLGLAICKEIINLHNGKIYTEKVKSGACFTFCIANDCTKLNKNKSEG